MLICIKAGADKCHELWDLNGRERISPSSTTSHQKKEARKSSADHKVMHRVEKFVLGCYAGNLICVLFYSLWLPCLLPFDIQDSQAHNDMH